MLISITLMTTPAVHALAGSPVEPTLAVSSASAVSDIIFSGPIFTVLSHMHAVPSNKTRQRAACNT